ncbi:hypothetical protein K488DRAFT_90833 [Vararia minispora EC-137]|uniref:Uncharacterized protein n=1 Tax=Vararia minispora EC-137 TaxID=1314806 RepID=A0ACB8Q748_9AGAM|nr:hypothetical protein K488DRAFT_90833 [Vararia minispora EC-137]
MECLSDLFSVGDEDFSKMRKKLSAILESSEPATSDGSLTPRPKRPPTPPPKPVVSIGPPLSGLSPIQPSRSSLELNARSLASRNNLNVVASPGVNDHEERAVKHVSKKTSVGSALRTEESLVAPVNTAATSQRKSTRRSNVPSDANVLRARDNVGCVTSLKPSASKALLSAKDADISGRGHSPANSSTSRRDCKDGLGGRQVTYYSYSDLSSASAPGVQAPSLKEKFYGPSDSSAVCKTFIRAGPFNSKPSSESLGKRQRGPPPSPSARLARGMHASSSSISTAYTLTKSASVNDLHTARPKPISVRSSESKPPAPSPPQRRPSSDSLSICSIASQSTTSVSVATTATFIDTPTTLRSSSSFSSYGTPKVNEHANHHLGILTTLEEVCQKAYSVYGVSFAATKYASSGDAAKDSAVSMHYFYYAGLKEAQKTGKEGSEAEAYAAKKVLRELSRRMGAGPRGERPPPHHG